MNKQILIIGTAVLLLFVGLSGCTDIEDIYNDQEDDTTDNYDTETIMITGNYIERTVHYLDKPVKLKLCGNYCDITVTTETNLVEVMLTGNYCTLRVSKSHSFNPSIVGNDNNVVYYD